VRKTTFSVVTAGVLLLNGAVATGIAQEEPNSAAASIGVNSRTLWITNDGTDNTACGPRPKPCRSISQAMQNASDGDTLWVGAGRYGNVSGDINFSGTGDERPDPSVNFNFLELRGGCMICVDKALHIYSIHGAAVTVIEGTQSTQFESNVLIRHDGVTFGSAGHGFTITGGNAVGLGIEIRMSRQNRHTVTVAGNVDVGDRTGFFFDGQYMTAFQQGGCPPEECVRLAQIVLSNNESVDNDTGFRMQSNTDGGPVLLRGNVASGASAGFSADPGDPHPGEASAGNGGIRLTSNVAKHCGTGFSMFEVGDITGNTSSANGVGFMVVPAGVPFRNNSAIGNAGPGVIVNVSNVGGDPTDLSDGGFSRFAQNNLFGNDRNRPALNLGAFGTVLDTGPSAHCGVLNAGALAAIAGPLAVTPPPVITIQAADNFWGSSGGPAPNGPGDNAGGVCDVNGGLTIAKPFARVDFAITSAPW
jgi:hypothetical protein